MDFASIPPGLLAFWFINDDAPIDYRLDYMRRCREGGIRQLAVHARPGNRVPYASREWYDMVRVIVEEAARTDMKIWLYDEDPYPSGAAGGIVMSARPDVRARTLSDVRPPAGMTAGETWQIGRDQVLWAGWRPLREGLPAVDLTADVGPLRSAMFTRHWDSRYYYPDSPRWPCPRGDVLDLYYAMRLPERPAGSAPGDYELVAVTEVYVGMDGPWGSLPDLLHPECFALFRDHALAPYDEGLHEHYGKTIPGIFTDEPKFHGGTPITADIFTAFADELGIDLRAELWRLTGQGVLDESLALRRAYRDWCGRRFLDAFLQPYADWAHERNLMLVGHLSPEDDPIQESHCLASVMPIMKTMTCAGCDVIVPAVGNAKSPILNLGSARAGSVRGQLGQPAAISETLALCDWDVTTRLSRQLLTWQKVLGIDRIFIHGFFSSSDGAVAQEAPPDYGPNSPVFAGISILEQWQRRLDTVFDGCTEQKPVAILNNMAPYHEHAPGAGGELETQLEIDRSMYWYLLLHCLEAQVPVDIVDAPDVAAASIADSALVVGNRHYSTLLIPPTPFLAADTAAALRRAAAAGVEVHGFCIGDDREMQPDKTLKRARKNARSLNTDLDFPDAAWCREHLPRAVALGGRDSERCFVRRATAPDGGDYLLAVNVEDRDISLTLPPETDGAWQAVVVDGELRARAGGGLAWRLPARGSGLFRLAPDSASPTRQVVDQLELADPTFKRLAPNVLRLAGWQAQVAGGKAVTVDYPKPWYELTDDWRVSRSYDSWAGPLPVESTASGSLRYSVRFEVDGELAKRPVLLLDPRASRGELTVWLNGEELRTVQTPLPGHDALRLPLPVTPGVNRLELRQQVTHAMDGLIAPLWLEGEFDVTPAAGKRPARLSPVSNSVSPAGWQAAGLPYYAGAGRYVWTGVSLPADAPLDGWSVVLDELIDSAVLTVNGEALGGCAWQPYRWSLPTLKRRGNRIELLVHSTAGNRLCMSWPNQPQGLIGRARLLRDAATGS